MKIRTKLFLMLTLSLMIVLSIMTLTIRSYQEEFVTLFPSVIGAYAQEETTRQDDLINCAATTNETLSLQSNTTNIGEIIFYEDDTLYAGFFENLRFMLNSIYTAQPSSQWYGARWYPSIAPLRENSANFQGLLDFSISTTAITFIVDIDIFNSFFYNSFGINIAFCDNDSLAFIGALYVLFPMQAGLHFPHDMTFAVGVSAHTRLISGDCNCDYSSNNDGGNYNIHGLPTPPIPNGYEFLGWYLDPSFYVPFNWQPITDDMRFYARLEPIVYYITWILNGGQFISWSLPIHYYTVCTANTYFLMPAGTPHSELITRVGHHFLGWSLASDCTDFIEYIPAGMTGDLRLYAHWEIQRFTVQFIVQGEVWQEVEVEWGAVFSDLSSSGDNSDLLLKDWFLDENLTELAALSGMVITGDIVLHGVAYSSNTVAPDPFSVPLWMVILSAFGGLFILILLAGLISRPFGRRSKRY